MFLRSIVLRHPRSFYNFGADIMHRNITIDTSPPQARWMKDTLDRSAFHRTVPVLAARVSAAKTASVLKAEAMRGFLINLRRVPSVIADTEHPRGDNKLVLFRVQQEAL